METNYEHKKDGTVIVVNNFKFEDDSLDHSWNSGRLCLVLFTDEEYEYVISMTSHVKDVLKTYYHYINDDNFMYYYKTRYIESTLKKFQNRKREYNSLKSNSNRTNVSGYLDLRKVYKIPVAYRDEIGKINYDDYKKILKRIRKKQNLENDEEIKMISK